MPVSAAVCIDYFTLKDVPDYDITGNNGNFEKIASYLTLVIPAIMGIILLFTPEGNKLVSSACQNYFTFDFHDGVGIAGRFLSYLTLVIPAIMGITWLLAAIASSLSGRGDAEKQPPPLYSVE